MILRFGNAPVPWTVTWTGEQDYWVGECPVFHRLAICQKSAPGDGKPVFGLPHAQRQRRAMHDGLCDLCAKPLKNRTKISLSRLGGSYTMPLEPLLHEECASICIEHCPALKEQLRHGELQPKRVTRYRVEALGTNEDQRALFVPGYRGPEPIGLARIVLESWQPFTLKQ